jgi:hypothetical protein
MKLSADFQPADAAVVARLRPACPRCGVEARVRLDGQWNTWNCLRCQWSRRLSLAERSALFGRPDRGRTA